MLFEASRGECFVEPRFVLVLVYLARQPVFRSYGTLLLHTVFDASRCEFFVVLIKAFYLCVKVGKMSSPASTGRRRTRCSMLVEATLRCVYFIILFIPNLDSKVVPAAAHYYCRPPSRVVIFFLQGTEVLFPLQRHGTAVNSNAR